MPRSTVIGEAVARMLVGIGVVVTITGIAVAAPQASSSQNLFTPGVARALDATIARIIRQANLPSVAVLAAIPDRGRYVFVGGVADLRTRAPRRFEQPFRIASITKTFVATAVLQLAARTGGDGGISTENIDLELLGVFALEIRFDTAAKTALPR